MLTRKGNNPQMIRWGAGRGTRQRFIRRFSDPSFNPLSFYIPLLSKKRHFTLTVPLSTHEYKWVPANCQGT